MQRTQALLEESYKKIYQSLSELRESFHKTGRLDDSNAKLDEVAKLFATYLSYKQGIIPKFPASTSQNLLFELQNAFTQTSKLPDYLFQNGDSIFGVNPTIMLRTEDGKIVQQLVEVVIQAIDLAFSMRQENVAFDLLNEAFGHFVRDNFRSNIEDAQYMTPPEVVDFMIDIVLKDFADEKRIKSNLVVCDPTCGVGSFLTSAYHAIKRSSGHQFKTIELIGQDKVERMARLSTINLALANVAKHKIFIGNSLDSSAPISNYNGKVDIVLTNPPFGARFSMNDIKENFLDGLSIFGHSIKNANTVDSELLFIDRDLELLADDGVMLIVVPDGVVSAKGMAATLRQHLKSRVEIRAIVELPPTTFAQAGTRTKTSILYIRKTQQPSQRSVFLAVVKDLGFQVTSKKGVPVKVSSGKNELVEVYKAYTNRTDTTAIILEDPSCVSVKQNTLLEGSWTPNHYSASRLRAIEAYKKHPQVVMEPLVNLVDFASAIDRPVKAEHDFAFISVLHVLGEGFIDISGALTYKPKTPGYKIKSGDLLISKINPRIPRVCLVPDFGMDTFCSTEFEVLRPKPGVNVSIVAFLLLSRVVQDQIVSLTSGTSSSHNRIRTSELELY